VKQENIAFHQPLRLLHAIVLCELPKGISLTPEIIAAVSEAYQDVQRTLTLQETTTLLRHLNLLD